jgi:hypothetical protein
MISLAALASKRKPAFFSVEASWPQFATKLCGWALFTNAGAEGLAKPSFSNSSPR